MTQEQTYHPTEHYVSPRSPMEVMDEFIRLYEPGLDSVSYITALGRLYAKTPYLHFMQEYARFVEIAQVEASESQDSVDALSHNSNFLAGAIMAIHINTYGASDSLKMKILSDNPLNGLRSVPECEEKNQLIKDCVGVMKEWDETGAEMSFDDQTEEFKESLLKLTIMVYNNIPHPNGTDDQFRSGFMYSSQMIWRLADGTGPPA